MRSILITGVAEGLGNTIASLFIERGDQVFGCDLPGPALERARESLRLTQGIAADISRPESVRSMFDQISQAGASVDVLVNNVGIAGPRANVEDISLEDWQQSFQTNVTGAFLCIQHVLGDMKRRRGGSIINVSTGSVRTVPVGRSPYIASKAALEALTRSVAREAGPFGVRCNAVQPGAMDNARLSRVLSAVAAQQKRSLQEVETELLQFVSTRSKVSMKEVASMVLYLASSDASNVTGQVIAVDGNIEWEA